MLKFNRLCHLKMSKIYKFLLTFLILSSIPVILSCSGSESASKPNVAPNSGTVEGRFQVPAGYERLPAPPGSFAEWLRKLKLKPVGTPVYTFDGIEKNNDNIYDAVLDIDVGKTDLQQCADAVMRLRAEYLYSKKQFKDIHFNFTNGFKAEYKKWMEGYRIQVKGEEVSWKLTAPKDTSYAQFRKYLDMVFMYAGSLSLSRELHTLKVDSIVPGNVYIHGGTPGHAVLVLDVARHLKSGKRIFMICQSYMPAQDIQILHNPNKSAFSPWYEIRTEDRLYTPEWNFDWEELMGF